MKVCVKTTVNASLENAWNVWISPEYIVKWNFASDEWHTPFAENDFQVDGSFNYRMEAKDGSFGFDFFGKYDQIIPGKLIQFTLGDGRKVEIVFTVLSQEQTLLEETFETEDTNPVELQQFGWQAILDNYKIQVESKPDEQI